MAAVLGHAGTDLLREHFSEYAPADNLYDEYGVSKVSTRGPLPPGLTPEEVKVLRAVQRRANFLDKGFNVCGAEFGLSVILASFVPIFGDVIHPVLGYTLIVRRAARQSTIPWWLTQRMILNLALAGGLGLLPGIGSVLLTSFRPNVRNAALLEEYLRMRSRNKPKVAAAQSEAPAEKKTDPDDKSHIADEKKTSTDETKAAPKDEGRVELSDEGLAIGGVAVLLPPLPC
ncbi:hypothetical protein BGW80DRAFT_1172617 [Lactifluus volemus]|nr:hypothetical protein BGW80DRAFT_1172617 [Lactifluus volemus]